MAQNNLTYTPAATIDQTVADIDTDKVLIVTDTNVEKIVLPTLKESTVIRDASVYAMPPGESGKTLETVTRIWDKLEEIGATRRSVVLNIGGGVVTDIGGFAAATFKRGVNTVNFPTTLLGAVDAATGGKTGINYRGLKNEIGAFHMPLNVIISPAPFSTLPRAELLSGYAEMIKTALISDKNFYISLLELDEIVEDPVRLGESVERCVNIKDDIVSQDPHEKGLRKVLNFGHTAGHAFESIGIEKGREITHGKAVAHGMIVAMILSHMKSGFESMEINHYKKFLKHYYGGPLMKCEEMDSVMEKMNKDKKNRKYGEPSFTLLKSPGVPLIDIHPTQEEIREALEIYIDMVG